MPTEPEMRGGWLTGWRVYRQVAARLRERITTGVYQAGSILPSEAALSAEFRVARNTIRRALEALEADGLILTVPSQRSPGPGGRPDRQRPLPVPGDRERARAEDQTGRPRAGRSTAERGRAGLVVRRVASHRTARLRRAGTRRPDRLPPREGQVRLPAPKTSWDVWLSGLGRCRIGQPTVDVWHRWSGRASWRGGCSRSGCPGGGRTPREWRPGPPCSPRSSATRPAR